MVAVTVAVVILTTASPIDAASSSGHGEEAGHEADHEHAADSP